MLRHFRHKGYFPPVSNWNREVGGPGLEPQTGCNICFIEKIDAIRGIGDQPKVHYLDVTNSDMA
jgi:hypothetical protein